MTLRLPRGNLVTPVGINPSDILGALALDADGQLIVTIGDKSVPIHMVVDSGSLSALVSGEDSGATPRILRTDTTGHPLVDGEPNTSLQPVGGLTYTSNTNLPAGASFQTCFTVPAGQRWRLTSSAFNYTGTITNVFVVAIVADGVSVAGFLSWKPIVSAQWYGWMIDAIFEAGWKLQYYVSPATAGDDLYMTALTQRIR